MTLVDQYDFFVDEIDAPPGRLTIVHGGEVYLRIAVKSTRYRRVSSHFSNDTPSGSFKVVKGNGD